MYFMRQSLSTFHHSYHAATGTSTVAQKVSSCDEIDTFFSTCTSTGMQVQYAGMIRMSQTRRMDIQYYYCDMCTVSVVRAMRV
jgi:hypothetical protein